MDDCLGRVGLGGGCAGTGTDRTVGDDDDGGSVNLDWRAFKASRYSPLTSEVALLLASRTGPSHSIWKKLSRKTEC